jgi:integrase
MSGQDQDGIYERPDSPFWWASYTEASGNSARRSTRVRREDDPRQIEAKRVRAHFIAELSNASADVYVSSLPQSENEATWDELVTTFFEEHEKKIAKSTVKRYEYALKHLYVFFTGRRLADIRRRDIKEYINRRSKAGAKPATINYEIAFMSGAYGWAQTELEWQITNPWRKTTLEPRNERTRYLSPEEAERLLFAAASLKRAPHLSDFIRLSVHTGMRSGEVLFLTWDRIDFDSDQIFFLKRRDQKNRKKSSIPINLPAKNALLSRLRAQQEKKLVTPWVFSHSNGARLGSIKKGFASACRKAGIEDLNPHDLRRTFGSWLVQQGTSIQVASGLLRHADVSITARIYAHLDPAQYRDATRVLAEGAKSKRVR